MIRLGRKGGPRKSEKIQRQKAPRSVSPGKSGSPWRRSAAAEGGGWISRDGYWFAPALPSVEQADLRPEALDVLAGEIIDRHIRLGRRGLAVCGPASGAGASFIAVNLAVALAQTGISTLLVDANLHRPGLDALIRAPAPRGGLADLLLAGDSRRADVVIHKEILPRLAVMYAGDARGAGSELIAGEAFQGLVSELLRQYECVIFDTPPANRCPDARVIGAATGYALLVSRRTGSFTEDMAMLSQQLDQDGVTIVGSVLNGV